QDNLALDVQFGPAADDVADGLVVARRGRLGLSGLLVFPEPHRDVDAGGEVLLALLPARRMLRLDLGHAGVTHDELLEAVMRPGHSEPVRPIPESRESSVAKVAPRRASIHTALPAADHAASSAGTIDSATWLSSAVTPAWDCRGGPRARRGERIAPL